MKYLAIIECTDAGGIEIGMAAIQMGYRPLFLLSPEAYKADTGLSLQNFEFIKVNTKSVDAIIDVLKKFNHPIVAIGTLVDGRIATAALVANKMGIPGPDYACVMLKDKARVAELCQEYSLLTAALTSDRNESQNILNTVFKNKSVVAKPRIGFGAIGIQFLFNENEKSQFLNEVNHLEHWILQEYFEGKLFSMEGWVEDNNLTFLGWTSRKKIKNTETEFRFEGYSTLSLKLTHIAQESIRQLFKKSNFQRGWFHIEFLIDLNTQRIMMIDANVGRIGGAMLPHVLAMTFSKTPSEIYQHALEVQIFGKSSIDLSPQEEKLRKIYKCICFGSPCETVIQEVILPKYPLDTPGLRIVKVLGRGDYVTRIGHDDMSWVGFVAGEESDVDHFAAQIHIKSENNIYRAAY